MKTTLICYFELDGVNMFTSSELLTDFRHGFWVDENNEFTHKVEKFVYWIPPSRIIYIQKRISK